MDMLLDYVCFDLLLSTSRSGLPSSSTFTLEDSAYQTSEQSTIEMDNDNGSIFDVYLVSIIM